MIDPTPVTSGRVARVFAFLALGVGLIVFVTRGPIRGLAGGDDFDTLYAQGRAWLYGVQIYERAAVAEAMQGSGREHRFSTPSYPVVSSVVMAPFGWMRWEPARAAWVGFNVVLVGLQLAMLLRVFGLAFHETRALLLSAAVLVLAPYSTGFNVGNPGMAAGILAVLSVCADRLQRPAWAGILVGLSAAFKIHLGAPFFLYFLLTRRWRAVFWGLALLVVLTIVAVAWLALHGVDLLESLHLWRNATLRLGGFSEDVAATRFTARARAPFHMINLHVLLHCFTDNYRLVNLLVPALGGLIGLVLGILTWKQRDDHGRWVAASAWGILSLLVVYHRLYDGVLIALPLAWSVAALGTRYNRPACITLLACLAFFTPGGAALTVAIQAGWVPEPLTAYWWWNAVVMTHQIWALLVILLSLMMTLMFGLTGPRAGLPSRSLVASVFGAQGSAGTIRG